jgi:hypothetical protein
MQRSLTEAVLISFGDKQIPKNVVALTSQRLAAANNMFRCFGLLPAESAGWIPMKRAHSIQGRQRHPCPLCSFSMPVVTEQTVRSVELYDVW